MLGPEGWDAVMRFCSAKIRSAATGSIRPFMRNTPGTTSTHSSVWLIVPSVLVNSTPRAKAQGKDCGSKARLPRAYMMAEIVVSGSSNVSPRPSALAWVCGMSSATTPSGRSPL